MTKREVIAAAAAVLSFAGAAYAVPNSSQVVVPSATVSSPLTIVKAVEDPSNLVNEVVATIGITGVTNDSGGQDVVCGNIWDDGVVKVSQCVNVPVGATQTVTFDLIWNGPIGQAAPGVGLLINDATSSAAPTGGALIASKDPLLLTIVQIPTLSPAMLAALAVLLLGAGFWMYRRNRA
jgi:hypothetical protein